MTSHTLPAEVEEAFEKQLMRYDIEDPMGPGSVEKNPTAVRAFLAQAIQDAVEKELDNVRFRLDSLKHSFNDLPNSGRLAAIGYSIAKKDAQDLVTLRIKSLSQPEGEREAK